MSDMRKQAGPFGQILSSAILIALMLACQVRSLSQRAGKARAAVLSAAKSPHSSGPMGQ